MKKVYEQIVQKKSLAVLIDPDKVTEQDCISLAQSAEKNGIDFLFVGGSLITSPNLHTTVAAIKKACALPVILFPGNNLYIDPTADALLLLSLISGRNPDLLIGQHIAAAPILKSSPLEILSTGYILIDGGKPTTVSYISNTTPIPADKGDIAACTAIAGELLGMKLIYLDAGSGAEKAISPQTIRLVKKSIDVPLIVGGGIRTVDQAKQAYDAGADLVVVGTQIENTPEFIKELTKLIR
ncbi:MAG: geranylgeranylglyceryl/heptaprenylglyceryl phosphate synthase [Cyclobacteriaceae bacterium]